MKSLKSEKGSRFGRVRIRRSALDDIIFGNLTNPTKDIIVTFAQMDYTSDSLEILGFSEKFEIVRPEVQAPEYSILVTPDGYKFVREPGQGLGTPVPIWPAPSPIPPPPDLFPTMRLVVQAVKRAGPTVLRWLASEPFKRQ